MNLYHKLYLFFIISLFASCGKEYTCSYKIQYFPPAISFVGFSETEIRNMSIAQFKANTSFSELINIDTLSDANPVFKGDTAYAKIESNYPYGFLQIKEGVDYKIRLITTGQEFVITNIKSGPDSHTWPQKDHCSPGAGQTRYWGLSYKLNYEDESPGSPTPNNFFVFLQH